MQATHNDPQLHFLLGGDLMAVVITTKKKADKV